jgi:hypothetical protein
MGTPAAVTGVNTEIFGQTAEKFAKLSLKNHFFALY